MIEGEKEQLPPHVQIRRGIPEDIPQIKECLIDSWVMHSRNAPDLLDEDRMRNSDIEKYYQECFDNPNSVVFVTEDEGQFAGFIRADVQEIPPFFKDNKILYLDDVYVKEAFRRKGIARALIRKVEDEARERNIRRVQGRVYTFNENIQKLLTSMGYAVPYATFDKVLQ